MHKIYGAIIGDIIGSVYEINEIKNFKTGVDYESRCKILKTSTPLFRADSTFTDDSILTCALCKALLEDKDYEKWLKYYGLKEVNSTKSNERRKFSKRFIEWLNGGVNDSTGNGCAMRISPLPYAFKNFEELMKETTKATATSHNTNEAITCAKAVAGGIFFALKHFSKQELMYYFENLLKRKIYFDIDNLRLKSRFTSNAMETVSIAIFCFYVSDNFEDCIRKSISVGGDCDTIAAIAGSLASAFYGIDDPKFEKCLDYIPEEYLQILNQFELKYN